LVNYFVIGASDEEFH